MPPTPLTVLTTYFNPARYRSRQQNYLQFAAHMRASPGVRLLTVECAFSGRAFELDADDATIQVRADQPLWIKENLLNLGWAQVDTPYVAWIDADVIFQEPSWAEHTVAALRDYAVIQPWSRVHNLDAAGQRIGAGLAPFCLAHQHGYAGSCRPRCCHTGYAWAARREVLDATGGFLEDLIVGGADHLIATALFDRDRAAWAGFSTSEYPARVDAWCRRLSAAVRGNVGYIDGIIHHLFHGRLVDRKYHARHAMTARHGFDAAVHLRKNRDGVNQIVGLPGLCEEVREYFHNRQEDGDSNEKDPLHAAVISSDL